MKADLPQIQSLPSSIPLRLPIYTNSPDRPKTVSVKDANARTLQGLLLLRSLDDNENKLNKARPNVY